MICKCGHAKSEHTITSGPNSIGQFFHGLCSVGSTELGPYEDVIWVSQGCDCQGFKLRWWWPFNG